MIQRGSNEAQSCCLILFFWLLTQKVAGTGNETSPRSRCNSSGDRIWKPGASSPRLAFLRKIGQWFSGLIMLKVDFHHVSADFQTNQLAFFHQVAENQSAAACVPASQPWQNGINTAMGRIQKAQKKSPHPYSLKKKKMKNNILIYHFVSQIGLVDWKNGTSISLTSSSLMGGPDGRTLEGQLLPNSWRNSRLSPLSQQVTAPQREKDHSKVRTHVVTAKHLWHRTIH